jgi:wobble nucleotide-excising tRNase
VKEKVFKNQIEEYKKIVDAGITTKFELCNVCIKLEVDTIQNITTQYKSIWSDLQQIIKEINTKIVFVQNEVKDGMLNSKDENLKTQLNDMDAKLKRLDEENECIAWKNAFEQFERKANLIKEKSDELEENQKIYLDQYFEVIDKIFKRYGARKFKIERGASNNKGFKKVFGINILFNDILITKDGKIRSVFSESDKRALALAIFMAKIECMPVSEKKDLILVLDDTITSFDDNRIKTVITSIMEVASGIEQTFIFAHHFMFARSINEKYGDEINFYKIDMISSANNGFYEINPDEEFSVGFEKAFSKIGKFNNAESNNLSENELRIFLEEYLKTIFAKQYMDNNLNNKKFGERIDELARIGVITEDVKIKLHHYRLELNSGSHTFQNCTIEDDRNFSIQLVQFVFDKVKLA